MLRDGDASVRGTAFTALAGLEDGPLAVAEAGLFAEHEDVRRRGLDLLVKQIKPARPRRTRRRSGCSGGGPGRRRQDRALRGPSSCSAEPRGRRRRGRQPALRPQEHPPRRRASRGAQRGDGPDLPVVGLASSSSSCSATPTRACTQGRLRVRAQARPRASAPSRCRSRSPGAWIRPARRGGQGAGQAQGARHPRAAGRGDRRRQGRRSASSRSDALLTGEGEEALPAALTRQVPRRGHVRAACALAVQGTARCCCSDWAMVEAPGPEVPALRASGSTG